MAPGASHKSHMSVSVGNNSHLPVCIPVSWSAYSWSRWPRRRTLRAYFDQLIDALERVSQFTDRFAKLGVIARNLRTN
jgi:hypothetical protein